MPHIKLFIVIFSLLAGEISFAATWENFVDLSLKKSPQVQQVRYQYQVPDLNYLLALQGLDWNATVESGSSRDRRQSMTDQTFHLTEMQTNTATVTKSFITGTDMTLSATTQRVSTHSVVFLGTEKVQSNSYLLDIEQNLWRNAFGDSIRAQLNAAQKDAQITTMQRKEAIENAIMQGGQLFWNAATAERRLAESEAELKRYEELVNRIERKTRNRYNAPGELAQVQAQYFSRQQTVRLNQTAFEQAVSDLKIYLPELTADDLKWNLNDPRYQAVVNSEKPDINQTRAMQLTDLLKEKQDAIATSVESANRSQLALVGQVGATGIDQSVSEAEREWLEGRRPSLYLGIKWSQTFGSGAHDAIVRNAKAQAQAQAISSQNDKLKLTTQANLMVQDINSMEQNLVSQDAQLKALRQAVQELTRSYNEGRTDINVLIQNITLLEAAESSNIEARASLELKYLEWQFFYDRVAVD
jgi:outer membrane protein TolC